MYSIRMSARIQKRALKGDPDAQWLMGMVCRNGFDDIKKDYTKAFEWFEKAAEQGHSRAQYKMGWCYANGDGVVKDLNEAEMWYRRAADQGHSDARRMITPRVPDIDKIEKYANNLDSGYKVLKDKSIMQIVNGITHTIRSVYRKK